MLKVDSVPAQSMPLLLGYASKPVMPAAPKDVAPSPRPLTVNILSLTNLLAFIVSLQASALSTFTPDIQTSINKLKKMLTKLHDLRDPRKLRSSVNNSGVMLESKIANSQIKSTAADTDFDLKAVLLQLFASLSSTEEITQQRTAAKNFQTSNALAGYTEQIHGSKDLQHKLLYKTESALLKIIRQQNMTLNESGNNRLCWFFEIPVSSTMGPITIPLTIYQEKTRQNSPNNDSLWGAKFSIRLQHSGLIQAEVELQGNRISIALRTESDLAARDLDRKQTTLRESLSICGLNLDTFSIGPIELGAVDE
jgi:hypothetical protein